MTITDEQIKAVAVDNIQIVCATCGIKVCTPRCDTDPPDAVELRGIVCSDCDAGGFDMPEYYDAQGNPSNPRCNGE